MTDRNLLERAAAAMSNSYSPYSRFPVGAAIECSDGSVSVSYTHLTQGKRGVQASCIILD